MYRPRKDAKKIAGQDVAIGKKDLYVRTRLAIFNNFKYVVAVILAYGGLAWPQGCKSVEQKRKFITEFTVPIDGAVAGTLGIGDITVKPSAAWTQGLDAIYIFKEQISLQSYMIRTIWIS